MLQTVAAAIACGVMLIFISRKLGLPAIVLLLAGGFLLGPAIWGEYAVVQPESLGSGLQVIVALSVGLILFEGGLTLDVSGYRSAPSMIKRLLTIGVLITWGATALTIWLFFDLRFDVAVLAASLVIVTGPTVIAPLLKRIQVEERVNSILHWEAVLIDPIGVFLAILCFEAFAGAGGQTAAVNLLVRVAVGLPLGAAGGLGLSWLVRRSHIDEELLNVVAFGSAVAVFGLAEAVRPETGLLSVTVAGFVFGLTGSTARLRQVRQFKAEITDLLIGTLFILLAARLEPAQFVAGFGLEGVLVVAVVMLVIRPLSIFVCSAGGNLRWRQKVFLSWVAPRGIVAASLASLVAIRLGQMESIENPRFVETFTYSVIICTIVLQGSTAGPLARLLGLKRVEPTGWLIVGAHAFARGVARFLGQRAGRKVVIVDTNGRQVSEAKKEGLVAIARDARDVGLAELPILQGVGNVLALTDNEDLNLRVCRNWADVYGAERLFRYDPSAPVMEKDHEEHEPMTGKVVWARLARPSLLAGEITRDEAHFIEGTDDPASVAVATPLVVFAGDKVMLDPGEQAAELSRKEGAAALYIRREADYLLRSLRSELFVTADANDLEGLFEEMIDPVVKLSPQLPREQTVKELVERERSFPTALGHGIATPHAYCGKLDVRLCVVARVPHGIDYGARDGEPVKLVFLLLSPQGDPEGHLATLGEIARMMISPRVREQALEAGTAEEIMRLVRQAQRRGE